MNLQYSQHETCGLIGTRQRLPTRILRFVWPERQGEWHIVLSYKPCQQGQLGREGRGGMIRDLQPLLAQSRKHRVLRHHPEVTISVKEGVDMVTL